MQRKATGLLKYSGAMKAYFRKMKNGCLSVR